MTLGLIDVPIDKEFMHKIEVIHKHGSKNEGMFALKMGQINNQGNIDGVGKKITITFSHKQLYREDEIKILDEF